MKYKKKPIVIEAIKWTGKNFEEIKTFTNSLANYHSGFQYNEYYENKNILNIPTSEGVMEARIGDYIIKEPFDKERQFYPCKPDIFEATYEKVENQ